MVCFVLFLSLILSFPLVLVSYVRSFFQRDARALIHIIFSVVELPQHLAAQKTTTATTTTYQIIIQTNMWNVYDSIIFSSLHRHILLLDNKIIVRGCIQRYIFFCGSKCRGRMRWSLLTIIYTPWRKNGIRTHAHTKQEEGKKAQSMNAFVCSFPEFVIKLVSLLLKQKNALTLMCAHGVWLHV